MFNHHISLPKRDTSELPNSLAFSRSDRKTNGVKLSRIDRASLRDMGGTISIILGICLSDHASLLIQLADNRRYFVHKLKILEAFWVDETYRLNVIDLWHQSRHAHSNKVLMLP